MKSATRTFLSVFALLLLSVIAYQALLLHGSSRDPRSRLFAMFAQKPSDPPEAFYSSPEYRVLLDDLANSSTYDPNLYYETSLNVETSSFMQDCLWLILSKKGFNFQRIETENYILKHPATTLEGRLLLNHYIESGDSEALRTFVYVVMTSDASDKAKLITWRLASAKSKKVMQLKRDMKVLKMLRRIGETP